jgi:hypothetical protein
MSGRLRQGYGAHRERSERVASRGDVTGAKALVIVAFPLAGAAVARGAATSPSDTGSVTHTAVAGAREVEARPLSEAAILGNTAFVARGPRTAAAPRAFVVAVLSVWVAVVVTPVTGFGRSRVDQGVRVVTVVASEISVVVVVGCS